MGCGLCQGGTVGCVSSFLMFRALRGMYDIDGGGQTEWHLFTPGSSGSCCKNT